MKSIGTISTKTIGKVILPLLLFTAVAHADGTAGTGSEVGILYGLSVPDLANTNPHDIWGVKGSAFLVPSFSLGGYYLLSRYQQGDNGLNFDYTLSGIEAAYHIQNGAGDTFIGLRLGLTKVHTVSNGVDLIYSPYHYGIAVGYDYSVATFVSLGFEGSYTHFEASTTTVSGTDYTEVKFGLMNFLFDLALHF